MLAKLQDAQPNCTLRTAWTIVQGCSRGQLPAAETAKRACDYLRRHAGLDEGSPAVQILTRAVQGMITEDGLRERAAAEVDRLMARAKAQLLQSVH